jgi:glycosyltransferase involved in cell wall biosynthesis
MRILIDALSIVPGETGGIETYIKELVRAFAQVDGKNSYLVLGTRVGRELISGAAGNFQYHCAPIDSRSRRKRVLYEQVCLPLVARNWQADVVLFPGSISSLTLGLLGIPSVVTIHDAGPMFYEKHFPEYFKRSGRSIRTMRFLVKASALRSAAILTVSNFSRQQVSCFTGVPEEKIFVVAPGCPPMSVPSGNPAAVLAKYGVAKPYIFSVGRSDKHKNLDTFVCAFARAKRDFGLLHHFVIAGPPGWGHNDLMKAIVENGVSDFVHVIGYVAAQDLPILYNEAELFVMPSLYEGFGFPVVEAMQLGVPTLISTAGALPEVAGDAAIYADPKDVDAMSQCLARVLTDERLRDSIVTKGKARAAEFSWHVTAAETLKVFESVTKVLNVSIRREEGEGEGR